MIQIPVSAGQQSLFKQRVVLMWAQQQHLEGHPGTPLPEPGQYFLWAHAHVQQHDVGLTVAPGYAAHVQIGDARREVDVLRQRHSDGGQTLRQDRRIGERANLYRTRKGRQVTVGLQGGRLRTEVLGVHGSDCVMRTPQGFVCCLTVSADCQPPALNGL